MQNYKPQFKLHLSPNTAYSLQRSEELTKEQKLQCRSKETDCPTNPNIKEIYAYCSPTRLMGHCVLVFIVETNIKYCAHYFVLSFNHLGVKKYFQYKGINKSETLASLQSESLFQISVAAGFRLLSDAYQQNQRYGTRVAKKLDKNCLLFKILQKWEKKSADRNSIWQDLDNYNLSSQKIVNALLLALKNMDAALVYDLATKSLQKQLGPREKFLLGWTHALEKCAFIKSNIRTCIVNKDEICYKIRLIVSDEEDNFKKVKLRICLLKKDQGYYLEDMLIENILPLSAQDPLCPINQKVFVCVYQVNDYQKIRTEMEESGLLYMSGEFEKGICFKLFKPVNPLEQGLDISKSIFAEFILTPTELIIFSCQLRNSTKINEAILGQYNQNSLQLKIKTYCSIKEIYQVIVQRMDLAEILLPKAHSFLIPKEKLSNWQEFCSREKNIALKFKNNPVFHFRYGRNKMEIIFYTDYAILNSFQSSLEILQRYYHLPDLELYSMKDFQTLSGERIWPTLKVIRKLKKDNYLKGYLPIVNVPLREIIANYQIIIN